MIELNRKKVLLHENTLNYKYKYIIRLIASFELPILSHNVMSHNLIIIYIYILSIKVKINEKNF